MKDSPFISICIPTCKNVAYVERLLGSIAQQDWKDFEIVMTDNSPDDNISRLATQYGDQLPVRYYKNDPPTGMAANFNAGLQKANGQWIKMMHDDDWFNGPHALASFAAAAQQTGNKFIFCASRNVYAPSGKIVDEKLDPHQLTMLEKTPLHLFYANVIGHPSAVMHYNDPELLYDTNFRWVVDIDFYMRFLEKHNGFLYLPLPLVNIGIDENQMSGRYYKNPGVEVPEYLSLLAKYPPQLLRNNEYVFHMAWNLVKKFGLRNAGDVKKCGYAGELPDGLEQIMQYQKNIPRIILKQTPWSARLMKKCFRQLQN